jgi:hypothetical protein
MSRLEDARNDLFRLQRALAALRAELDEIEKRPPFHQRGASVSPQGIEKFVDHFATALERSRMTCDMIIKPSEYTVI